MRMFIFALLAICVATPATASKPHPAVPKGNPALWVDTSDYPPSALREDGQGVVRFLLDIDATGVPVKCTVIQSSGRADLDDTACQLITERARFEPATDSHGKPVAGTFANSVRWQIPQDRPAPMPGELVTSIVIEKDGTVSSCTVDKATGQFEAVRTQICNRTEHFDPIVDSDGNPVRKRIRSSMKIEREDVP
ncbi:MAG TPA: energy transducer TonB [Croceibacterium sp.]|nr:energy transducer TonB [Croceibacterium sp.]